MPGSFCLATFAIQLISGDFAPLQERMGLAGNTGSDMSQTDKFGEIPWWAQEMGMTEEEYYSGLASNAVTYLAQDPQPTVTRVKTTQVPTLSTRCLK